MAEEKTAKEIVFLDMTSKEWDWIRKKSGVMCRDIGEKACEAGRSKPYHPVTVFLWTKKPVMTTKQIELLYLCLRPEQFTLHRKQWKELPESEKM